MDIHYDADDSFLIFLIPPSPWVYLSYKSTWDTERQKLHCYTEIHDERELSTTGLCSSFAVTTPCAPRRTDVHTH